VIAKLTRSLWVRALLTLVVLVLLISRIDIRDSAAALGRLNLHWLASSSCWSRPTGSS
jgi:hypothetical protein